jgi:hypothetical protein
MYQKMERKKTLETPEQSQSEPRKFKEEDEFFEEEKSYEQEYREPEETPDERHEKRLKEKRRWLRSLTQADRDFIAKYGEEAWKNWKGAGWRDVGKERQTS